MSLRSSKSTLVLALFVFPAAVLAQQGQEENPAAALSEALGTACRHDETQFARYLTADNATAFQGLPAPQRIALMKRLVLLEEPGRPLLSSDAQGHTVLRCEAPGITTEMRFRETRLRENLAFVPVGFAVEGRAERHVEFGMVREGGGWKLLSVGLLLLNLAELSRQWTTSELEARETEAIAALSKLADSINTYRRAFGRLPETLAQLGPAPKEGISPEAAGLVDAELATGKKGGYVFRYRLLPASSAGSEAHKDNDAGFELAATPAEYGKTGRRSFFLDASGALRGGDKQGAVATGADPRIEPR